ncbi:MAG: hypothetical protein WKF54_01790 [Nocardioidaceae bacterium]
MRLARLLAVLVLTVALLVPTVLATSTAGAAAKPHRHFNYSKIVKLQDGSLSFRAQVANYPNGFIALMKKTCLSCTWQRIAIRRTTEFGRIFMPVQAPAQGRWYWRYRTPETAKFAVTYSATWYTYRH